MADQQALRNQSTADIDAFLEDLVEKRGPTGRGRLMFALDATASRQPTWDTACQLQSQMFAEVASIGSLDVQLVYFRGSSECKFTGWVSDAEKLAKAMQRIVCEAGWTQLRKILAHAKKETALLQVSALVFVGDALEMPPYGEDDPDKLIPMADELGRLGVPCFMFQEGGDETVERVFRDIAERSHGAYHRFDPGAAQQLAALLKAVATFATGGLAALEKRRDAEAVKLLSQMKKS
jgi:hypothetical protein